MDSKLSDNSTNDKQNLSRAVIKRVFQVVSVTLFLAAIMFVSAGDFGWIWAWAYLGVSIIVLAINASFMSPELIAERGEPKENIKSWDRTLTKIVTFPLLAIPLVAGLDERFGWSSLLTPAGNIVGLVLFGLGQGLFSWALASNAYFSTAVRIQMDRGQTVATGGPYRFVRHPGYTGFIISYLGLALSLGSWWALIPAGSVAVLFVVRTALEDRTLQEELDGYAEFARRVRFRLLPGIW